MAFDKYRGKFCANAMRPDACSTLAGLERLQTDICRVSSTASIIASATPSASVSGKSTSALEERGDGGLRRHALFLASLRVE